MANLAKISSPRRQSEVGEKTLPQGQSEKCKKSPTQPQKRPARCLTILQRVGRWFQVLVEQRGKAPSHPRARLEGYSVNYFIFPVWNNFAENGIKYHRARRHLQKGIQLSSLDKNQSWQCWSTVCCSLSNSFCCQVTSLALKTASSVQPVLLSCIYMLFRCQPNIYCRLRVNGLQLTGAI